MDWLAGLPFPAAGFSSCQFDLPSKWFTGKRFQVQSEHNSQPSKSVSNRSRCLHLCTVTFHRSQRHYVTVNMLENMKLRDFSPLPLWPGTGDIGGWLRHPWLGTKQYEGGSGKRFGLDECLRCSCSKAPRV